MSQYLEAKFLTLDLKRKLAIGFSLGIIVFIGLILYGDVQEIGRLLHGFQKRLVPAILSLTILSYILRGIRFHYYLRQVGVRNITLWTSIRVFIGGFVLSLTPGKLGELVRVLWIKNLTGASPAKVAPAIIVDRIVDGIAMAILASIGTLAYPQYWPAVALILTVLITGIIVVQIRPLAFWILNLGEKLPFVVRFAHHLQTLYESIYELLRVKNFVVGLGIGLIVWTVQGVAFHLVLIGLGVVDTFSLVLLAIFTLAVGSLLGGASSSPGGLGAAEASMTIILQSVVGISQNMAATATLLIRFFTLWLGVLLGVFIVIIWRKILFRQTTSQADLSLVKSPELIEPDLTFERTN
jgi:uncharacterized protein (TIRG00374 family)